MGFEMDEVYQTRCLNSIESNRRITSAVKSVDTELLQNVRMTNEVWIHVDIRENCGQFEHF